MAKADERVIEALPLSTVDDQTGADLLLDRLRAEYREPRVDIAPELNRGAPSTETLLAARAFFVSRLRQT
jgi:hypothetical protein